MSEMKCIPSKKNVSRTIFTVLAQVASRRTVLQYIVYSSWYKNKAAYSWLYWLTENSAPEKGVRN
jgi:hypothetical protein